MTRQITCAVLAAKIGVVFSGLDRLTTVSWSRLTIAGGCMVAMLAVAFWIAGLRGLSDPRTDRMPFTAIRHSSHFAWMLACALWGAGLGLIVFYVAASTVAVLSQHVSATTATIDAAVARIDRNSTPRSPCEVKATLWLQDGRKIGTCLVAKWTRTPPSYAALQEGSPVSVVLRHTMFGTSIETLEPGAQAARP